MELCVCVCVLGWACYHPWQIKRFKWCVLIKPEQGLRSVPASPRCVCLHVDMWGKQGQMDRKLRLPHPREHTHTHTHTHTHLCQLFFNGLHKQSGVVPLKCSYGLKAAAAAHPPLRQAKLVQPDLLHQTPPAAFHTLLKCTDFYTAPSPETLLCWHVSKELDVPALDNVRLKTRLGNQRTASECSQPESCSARSIWTVLYISLRDRETQTGLNISIRCSLCSCLTLYEYEGVRTGKEKKKAARNWLWPAAADTDCDACFDKRTQFEHSVIIL